MGSRHGSEDPVVTHQEWVIQIGPAAVREHGGDKTRSSPQSIAETFPAASRTSSNGPVLGSRSMSPHPNAGNGFVPQDPLSKAILTVMQVAVSMLNILLGLMFSCLDMSVVSTALVKISVDLHNDYLNAPWVILAYLLTYMAFAVGFSKLSDIYGRRNMLIVSWAFFAGFSFLCMFATDMMQLIVGRALQGIGGAGLYSLSQICLIELGLGGPETVGAMVGVTLSISYVLGPLLGGVISTKWTWRGIFMINAPFGIIAIGFLLIWWPDKTRQHLKWQDTLVKIDFIGNVLLISASALLVFAMQQGGSLVADWRDPEIVVTLTLSALSWFGLCVWEILLGTSLKRLRVEPIFPIRLALKRAYVSSLLTTFFSGWSYIALVVDIPERLQIVNGDSSLVAGLHLLPMLGATAFGSFAAGIINKKKNLTALTTIAGSAFQVLGLGLIYGTTSDATTISLIVGYTALYGLGVGLVFAAVTMMTTVEARNIDLAVAQGAVAQARVLGGCIGLTVGTLVFNQLLDAIHRSPMAIFSMPPDLQPLVTRVYVSAFSSQMLGLLIVSIIGLVTSIGTLLSDRTPVASLLGQNLQPQKTGSARTSDMELGDIDRRFTARPARIHRLPSSASRAL
ncbi:MFS general substrate transporter [Coniochaeta ligniaria NRRL 30616]|uniref:MFS general substrate transporter n=1 Tax=Coniochaeta ligniaria NRRL 30616 TaxID=1408157 RepID=A0A1J7ITM2_9PEZI|nr:MFS general substrate transporter [Coniochaeta ligniaria NRRL 30616]